jgi:hypothetical protein
MEAIRLTRTIRSQTLRIKELAHLQGQTVEIIILVTEQPAPPVRGDNTSSKPKKAGGLLAQYRNPKLIEQEEQAWELAIQEKYAHR